MIAKIVLFLVATTLFAAAQSGNSFTDPFGNTLRLSSPFSAPPTNGLFPVVVEMTAQKRAAKWAVAQRSYLYGDYHRNMVFECPAGESRRAVVLLNCIDTGNGSSNGVDLEIVADGVRDRKRFDSSYRSGSFAGSLVGQKLIADHRQDFGIDTGVLFNTELASTDWRAYAGYISVILSDAEWRTMEPGARVALAHYARSGGSLLVVVPDEASASTLPAFPVADDPKRPGRVGFGKATTLAKANLNEKNLLAARYHESIDENSRATPSGETIRLWKSDAPEYFPARSSHFTGFLMLIVLVAFAILIGPVNLFVFAPAKKRHRLFFSVPVIALSTSLILLVFVLLSDGLGGKGHRFLLIENRPADGENVNHIVQYQTSRCGVLFNTGFTTGVSATIQNLGIDDYESYSGSSGEKKEIIAEADNLEGNGSWFVSRTSQNYRLAATVPGRGRIELRGAGTTAILTSTFAYPLEALWFRDKEGKWWKTGPLRMGEPVGVTEVTSTQPLLEWKERLDKAPTEIQVRTSDIAQRHGCFIAFTSAPEAVPTHSSIRWTDHAVVTGSLFHP